MTIKSYLKRKSNRIFRSSNIEKLKLAFYGFNSTTPIVVDDYRLIYFPIPKAATKSVKTYFKSILGLSSSTSHSAFFPFLKIEDISNPKYVDYLKFTFVRNPWDRLVSSFNTKLKVNINMNKPFYRKNIAVTNTFSFLGNNSLKEYPPMNSSMSFTEFIEAISITPDQYLDKHISSQHQFVVDDCNNLLVDYIGKVESFNEDFKEIMKRNNLPDNDIPYLSKSNELKNNFNSKKQYLHYKEYYNNYLWELVEKRFSKDIKLFGYNNMTI